MVNPYTQMRKLFPHAEPMLLLHLDNNGKEINGPDDETLSDESKMQIDDNPTVNELPDSGKKLFTNCISN